MSKQTTLDQYFKKRNFYDVSTVLRLHKVGLQLKLDEFLAK